MTDTGFVAGEPRVEASVPPRRESSIPYRIAAAVR